MGQVTASADTPSLFISPDGRARTSQRGPEHAGLGCPGTEAPHICCSLIYLVRSSCSNQNLSSGDEPIRQELLASINVSDDHVTCCLAPLCDAHLDSCRVDVLRCPGAGLPQPQRPTQGSLSLSTQASLTDPMLHGRLTVFAQPWHHTRSYSKP